MIKLCTSKNLVRNWKNLAKYMKKLKIRKQQSRKSARVFRVKSRKGNRPFTLLSIIRIPHQKIPSREHSLFCVLFLVNFTRKMVNFWLQKRNQIRAMVVNPSANIKKKYTFIHNIVAFITYNSQHTQQFIQ